MNKPRQKRALQCIPRDGGYTVLFQAMASPCEVLIDHEDDQLALTVGNAVAHEAWRIEDKYSRYNEKSVCGQLNKKAGSLCSIDDETFSLLQFADQCYHISDGLFDLTSGVLRKAWTFDCSDNIPSQREIDKILPLTGWQKVIFDKKSLRMQPHMEIDFGGIGKEYAVDRALNIAMQLTDAPVLVNFGGDLAVSKARRNDQAWSIGIEHPSFKVGSAVAVTIKQGAIATSGDAKRYLLKEGKRYSHILNVKTGWPVEGAPKGITVAAPKCIQAGLLSTLALLQGANAQSFLTEQEIKFWLHQ